MHNPHLETFLRVANAGSFNRAAEIANLTPTALIKQINLLEDHLGVTLFQRTNRGLTLTKAGESLLHDAHYIIQYSQDAVARARKAMSDPTEPIRIGISPLTPAILPPAFWDALAIHCPNLRVEFVPFVNSYENAREILNHLESAIDALIAIFDEVLVDLSHCKGLELTRHPLCCAVPRQHPLASRSSLSIQDLYGESLMIVKRGYLGDMDLLRNNLQSLHPSISIVDFDVFNVEIFNQCVHNNILLVADQSWTHVHPLVTIVPVDWEYTIPFGILHSASPSPRVQKFLDFCSAFANHSL